MLAALCKQPLLLRAAAPSTPHGPGGLWPASVRPPPSTAPLLPATGTLVSPGHQHGGCLGPQSKGSEQLGVGKLRQGVARSELGKLQTARGRGRFLLSVLQLWCSPDTKLGLQGVKRVLCMPVQALVMVMAHPGGFVRALIRCSLAARSGIHMCISRDAFCDLESSSWRMQTALPLYFLINLSMTRTGLNILHPLYDHQKH